MKLFVSRLPGIPFSLCSSLENEISEYEDLQGGWWAWL